MITNYTYIIPILQFKQLFNDFSESVRISPHYEKMFYGDWKVLKNNTKDVVIQEDFNARAINLHNDTLNLTLSMDDNSFGDFLLKHTILDSYVTSSNNNNNKRIETVSTTEQSVKIVPTSFADTTQELTHKFAILENAVNKKEKKNMKFNFDFGPVKGDAVRMSPYGMAIKNSDNIFVAYDQTNETIVDVDVFNFDGSKFMYKMPVALKDVAIGDVVIHNHVPMFVTDVNGNTLEVVDIFHGENKSIIPTTNMFGFNFVTKVVSFIDIGTPNKDNPFGNMLPFIMMSDKDADMKDVAMAMMFMNGNMNLMQNPMMMFMLIDRDNNSDMLPLMMAMNMNKSVDNSIAEK